MKNKTANRKNRDKYEKGEKTTKRALWILLLVWLIVLPVALALDDSCGAFGLCFDFPWYFGLAAALMTGIPVFLILYLIATIFWQRRLK